MRIDKFLSNMGIASRTEAAKAAKAGRIFLDGVPCKNSALHMEPEKNTITYCGQVISYRNYTYLMMNKPEGYVSATDDPKEKTVLELLPESLQKIGLFPAGRLDKNTLGLLILTNNGQLAHQLLSPKHHVEKKYAFHVKFPIRENERLQLEQGVTLEDGYCTKEAKIMLSLPEATTGVITLTEGKYHQIKRMMEAISNQITDLERIQFASLLLDAGLQRGQWRYLTAEEIASLENLGSED